MTETRAYVQAVHDYLDTNPDALKTKSLADVGSGILNETLNVVAAHNAVCPKEQKWPSPRRLSVAAVTEALFALRRIRLIDLYESDRAHMKNARSKTPRNHAVLAVYDAEDGLWNTDELEIIGLIKQLEGNLMLSDINNVMLSLKSGATRTTRTQDPDLVPVANGIFDYKSKKLLPFSPDYVFLMKSDVAYVDAPVNPIIKMDDGADWDVESWMASLSDDPEVVDALWKIVGACVRPNVRWNKAAFLYSTRGGNGKGTFCVLCRNLCGNPVSISMTQFEKEFALGKLIGADAIITDENNVGVYVDKAESFKAVVTGDVVTVNRKYVDEISYTFKGFTIQCLNSHPKVRDRSDSFARRMLYIPFDKTFTKIPGVERTCIKDDYLSRPEVLEYVLHKVLNMDYASLPEPAASKALLQEYRLDNDPVLDFATEILPELRWDLVPFTFLYDLYKAWFAKNRPSGTVQNSRAFISDLTSIDLASLGYCCPDKSRQVWVTPGNMGGPEPLIAEYGLTEWMNPAYKGKDPDKICRPDLKKSYRGIQRLQNVPDAPGDCADGPVHGIIGSSKPEENQTEPIGGISDMNYRNLAARPLALAMAASIALSGCGGEKPSPDVPSADPLPPAQSVPIQSMPEASDPGIEGEIQEPSGPRFDPDANPATDAAGNVYTGEVQMQASENEIKMLAEPPAPPAVPLAEAPGTSVAAAAGAEIDWSNVSQGYVCVRYPEATWTRLKAQVIGPEITYSYDLQAGPEWTSLPLSDGQGTYTVRVLQNVEGTKYAILASTTFESNMADEFGPFLHPNQYVDYQNSPNVIAKSQELAGGLSDPLDKVRAVYDWTVENLTYDNHLAATVQVGYLPDLEQVLSTRTGICFDYAALMTAMLRIQNVPTKLVIGYAGTTYHAWVSVWTEESGWIDGVIFFNGTTWQRMDPTFAGNSGNREAMEKYIGDGSNYAAKYLY